MHLPYLLLCLALLIPADPAASKPSAFDPSVLSNPSDEVSDARGRLPLFFVENQGQYEDGIRYALQGAKKSFFFSGAGIVIALMEKMESEVNPIFLSFEGADPNTRLEGLKPRKTAISYFRGAPDQWIRDLPTFEGIQYVDLWPGIDLVYTGTSNALKYAFIVRPGADPSAIRLLYHGIASLTVDASGRLKIVSGAGSFEDGVPSAYQIVEGKRKPVPMAYRLSPDQPHQYGFDIGAYDPDLPLILDPMVTVYCGYVGGCGYDKANDLALDHEGCAYICGYTWSPESSFPCILGPCTCFMGGSYDAFVAKVNATGTDLVYCGYIGGTGNEIAESIAVDDQGNAYVAGHTTSSEASFPVVSGPSLTLAGQADAFVARINSAGTGLDYCGYIGGAFADRAYGIDVDTEGAAYVAGYTNSRDPDFPVTVGPDLTYNGDTLDGFVAKVNDQGTGLAYCGYIGGAGLDRCLAVAVDEDGEAYVAGYTNSPETTFPVSVGPDLTFNGLWDVFVARVNSAGTALSFCGYVGGAGMEFCEDIALQPSGDFCVVGQTDSTEETFPVSDGPLLVHGGGWDAFIAKIQSNGANFRYCGYIGGTEDDYAGAVTLGANGKAYVTGHTWSADSFPIVLDDGAFNGGSYDAFVTKVSSTGKVIEYSRFLGGGQNETGTGIAVNDEGCTYVTGNTTSSGALFPAVIGPDLTYNGPSGDAFVSMLALSLRADADEVSIQGGEVRFFLNGGGKNADHYYLLLGSLSGTEPGLPLPGGQATAPIVWDDFTNLVLAKINTPVFDGFMGLLDDHGAGEALMTLPAVNASNQGKTMTFAFVIQQDPVWDFASDPVEVTFGP